MSDKKRERAVGVGAKHARARVSRFSRAADDVADARAVAHGGSACDLRESAAARRRGVRGGRVGELEPRGAVRVDHEKIGADLGEARRERAEATGAT